MYDCIVLDSATWPRFARLAGRHIPATVRRDGPNARRIAVGASLFNRPVGLIIAEINHTLDHAAIRDLQVAQPFCTAPIGTLLVRQLETELRARGCMEVEVVYSVDEDHGLYERALAESGWAPSEVTHYLYEMHWELHTQTWVRSYRLPPGCEIVPWADVTSADREQIRHRQEKEGWYPPSVDPFLLETSEQIDFACSIGLRYRGQVVGWVIGERLDPRTAYCTVAFVTPELRRTRAGPALMAEIARLQSAAGVRITFVDARPGSIMSRFAEHAWKSIMVQRVERRGSSKRLQAE